MGLCKECKEEAENTITEDKLEVGSIENEYLAQSVKKEDCDSCGGD